MKTSYKKTYLLVMILTIMSYPMTSYPKNLSDTQEELPKHDQNTHIVRQLFLSSLQNPEQFDDFILSQRSNISEDVIHCIVSNTERLYGYASTGIEYCKRLEAIDETSQMRCIQENEPAKMYSYLIDILQVLRTGTRWQDTLSGQAAILAKSYMAATAPGLWEQMMVITRDVTLTGITCNEAQ